MTRTDAELVARSLDGDTGAFAELYARHATAVRVHVRRVVRAVAVDVEDAVQEAFVRAWCRLPQLRDGARFVPWVRAIAVSAARDRLRAAGREVPVAEVPEAGGRADTDDALALRQAVTGLPAAQRAAIQLHYFAGLSPEEAGRRLGVPATTVRGRLQTGRAALRARLSRGGDVPGASGAGSRSLQTALSAIRRRNLQGTHDLRGQPAVLFCGVPTDVEVVPSPDGLLHLRGSVWAVGEGALGSVALHHDAVDDYLHVGPHAGVLFVGSRGGPAGQPVAETCDTGDWWAGQRERLVEGQSRLAAADHALAVLRRPCLRLSLVASAAQGLWVGDTDAGAWAELARHLAHNSTGVLGWHGPEARAAITVEVPVGATFVVATHPGTAGPVHVGGVEAAVVCLGTGAVAVERHRGDVTLWQARLDRVSGLAGSLRQYHAAFGIGRWDEGRGGRDAPEPSVVEGLDGTADVAVARDLLVLRRPAGRVRVDNRFGDTVLEWGADTSGEVTSVSGRVEVRVPAGGPVPVIEANSPAGEVRWDGDLEADWGLRSWNTTTDLGVRPEDRQRDLRLRSETGVVMLARER